MHFNGTVMQWQDTSAYSYGAPPPGASVMSVTEKEWANREALKWVRDGKLTDTMPPVEPPLLAPELLTTHVAAVSQAYMNRTAQAHRYKDVDDACSYADEPEVPRFQAEGKAFRAWRSQVRLAQIEMLDALQGATGYPSTEEIEARLPPFTLAEEDTRTA
ncbi:hypothetical protein AL520_13280 [Achromobacter xylosoxidans]|nr:hypothetical protein AL520_13280 [Achromobacter xylosoxidans]